MNPSELAIIHRVPHSIVLSLSPKYVASLWEMDTPKGDPIPLRCVLQSLKKPGVTWKPVALSYYQTLRDQLQTRRYSCKNSPAHAMSPDSAAFQGKVRPPECTVQDKHAIRQHVS